MTHRQFYPTFILFMAIILVSSACQNELHRSEKKDGSGAAIEKKEDPLLIGPIGIQALKEGPYSLWFSENYQDYDVNEALLPELTSLLDNVTIRIFMGTWCEDSQTYVPPFLKILKQIDFTSSKVRIVAVDRDKMEPRNSLYGNNIEFVPTFIFLKDDEELGRIVEAPESGSLEKDMIDILRK